MGLVIAKAIRINGVAYCPGDEEALSEIADKKMLDNLKKRELLVDIPDQKVVTEKPAPKKTSMKVTAPKEAPEE